MLTYFQIERGKMENNNKSREKCCAKQKSTIAKLNSSSYTIVKLRPAHHHIRIERFVFNVHTHSRSQSSFQCIKIKRARTRTLCSLLPRCIAPFHVYMLDCGGIAVSNFSSWIFKAMPSHRHSCRRLDATCLYLVHVNFV